jgi:hypothetical protein
MVKKKRLEFGSYREASTWFDTSDLDDYHEQMVPVEFSFDLRKMPDLVTLDRKIAKDVRQLARRWNIPTRTLVNRLLKKSIEGLR